MVEQGRQRAAIISVAVSALGQPERLDRSLRETGLHQAAYGHIGSVMQAAPVTLHPARFPQGRISCGRCRQPDA
jgi:hypothetical protein